MSSKKPSTSKSFLDSALQKSVGIDTVLIKFWFKQRCVGFEIPDAPHFDEASTAWFSCRLKSTRKYLEFGSGGSTVLAARFGIPFVTVDSDRFFLASLKKKIERDGLRRPNQAFIHAHIGVTEYWGRPLCPWRASALRLSQFRRYSDPPRQCLDDGTLPDLILIDGRFRVACALKVLRVLGRTTKWVMMVDDYVGRPEYHVIAQYAELDRLLGRAALFTASKDWEGEELQCVIEKYETVHF